MDTHSIDFRSSYGGTELGPCLSAGLEVPFLHGGADFEEGKGERLLRWASTMRAVTSWVVLSGASRPRPIGDGIARARGVE
jgi:hypothetical protein